MTNIRSNRESNHAIRNPQYATRNTIIFWSIIVVSLALDLWSKQAVFNRLSTKDGQSVSIIDGFVDFVMSQNAGAAFGIAAGGRPVLITISIIALITIFAVFLFAAIKQKIVIVAMAMFAAGVMGNLYDRVFNNGLVRDFIDVYWRRWHWPAFNVADSLLCIAVGLLIISNFTKPRSSTGTCNS